MSRMILPLALLTLLCGCHWTNLATNHVSLVTARIQTLGPSQGLFSRHNGECSDCVPHRPWTDGYKSWWDDLITGHTAQRCAFRGLHDYRQQCGRPVSHHFKMGFIAAYEDLAFNRRPAPPIIPPPKYWNAYYRSCAGQPLVDDWFAGYDAGREMGLNGGVSRFHEIYMRRNGCGVGLANRSDYGQADQYSAAYDQTDAGQGPLQPMPQEMPVAPPSAYSAPSAEYYGPPGNYGFQGQQQ